MRRPSVDTSAVLRIALLLALGIATLVAVRGAAAQTPAAVNAEPAPAPGVSGRVVDAATGDPLGDAFVLLLPLPEGALAGGAGSSPATIAQGRRVRTDADGRYRFQRLAAGSYRLHVSRIGYDAATVDLTVDGASPDVGVGLVVAPVTLTAIRVVASVPRDPSRPVAGIAAVASDDGRLLAARARQAAYVSTDVRELTEADVGEAVTLAESDLFRGLQRAPGVSTRDEWSAELWTRGARADQTRITWDGLPLFAPYHLFGALSGVMPEAAAAAFLHPGVRPASLGEGSAAVLDLRSAPGRGDRSLGGRGELALTSARVALDGAAGPVAWSGGLRRSYWDQVARVARSPDAGNGVGVPYSFGGGFGRADYSLGGGRTLAASVLAEGDRDTRGGSYGLRTAGDTRWGNRLARVTYTAPLGALRLSQTVGGSTYGFDHDSSDRRAGGYVSTFAPVHAAVQYLSLRGDLARAADAGAAPPWSAGYEVSAQRARYAGPARAFYSGDEQAPGDSALDGRATVTALWGERRWRATPHATLSAGLRVESATIAGRGTSLYPAPRLALGYDVGPVTRLSAAVGRSVQYTQSLPRLGHEDDARLYPNPLTMVAGGALPPLRTDLLTVGVERWLGRGWLGAANAYARRASGIATQDPTPGYLTDRQPLFVVARGSARGVEVSARRLAGRRTASISYSYASSTLDALGEHYAAPEDRRHTVDVTLTRQLSRSWRLSTAYSAATGSPYTPYLVISVSPETTPRNGRLYGAPASRRRPPLLGFAFETSWTHAFARWQLGAYAQVHSTLAVQSSGSYRGDGGCFSTGTNGLECYGSPREDTVFLLPALGLRFAF